jgi:hypothetical protein
MEQNQGGNTQGAIPKTNRQSLQAKKIVKTVLANKSMDEQCALMDAMEQRQLFRETEIALNYSDTLLNIFDYIEAVMYRIDTMMLNKFWQCVTENRCVDIHASVFEWLGYDSGQDRDNKASFIQLLDAHNIGFKQIKHTDPDFQNYPDLVEEANSLPVNSLNRKKWIIMGSRDFKEMVMCLRTSKASEIRRYYLAIEDLFKMYCEYTLHFQLRREKRRLGKKQGTIDDLVRGMEEMKLERKEAERKHDLERKETERRHKALINRADGLLQHAEQAEEDRLVMMADINAVRRVAAPHPDEPKNVHRMALIKMSPNYEWVEGDPKYYSEVDAVAIRTQIKYFNGRVKKIQSAGDGTNSDASILTSFDSPNPISLFNRLKDEHSDRFTFVNAAGIKYEPRTEAELVETMNKIHASRMDYPN